VTVLAIQFHNKKRFTLTSDKVKGIACAFTICFDSLDRAFKFKITTGIAKPTQHGKNRAPK
jgi:hypothetical protein